MDLLLFICNYVLIVLVQPTWLIRLYVDRNEFDTPELKDKNNQF